MTAQVWPKKGGEGIGGNQRRQMSGCGARTAVTSPKAVLESSDVQRFVWILMEFRRRR
jgi:hypothetical protein